MIKHFSCFAGIGAFEKALTKLGIDYDLVGFSEIDKYAIKSYCAIHNVPESKNYGDITKNDEWDLPSDIDLLTYGFCCQDVSLAGKQKGAFEKDENGDFILDEKGNKKLTRSGLFYEAAKLINRIKPKVCIAENVKNLTSKKHKDFFDDILKTLEEAGYNNHYKILNSRDYGIPQNRERVFIVSIRKDIDTGCFKFPEGFPLELRLKDMLEDVVDEKFYISNTSTASIIDNYANSSDGCIQAADLKHYGNDQMNRVYSPEEICPTVLTKTGGGRETKILETSVKKVGNVNPSGHGMNGTVVDSEGIARTITIEKGEGQKILVREATKQGYAEAFEGDSINLEQPNSKTRRGRVGKQVAQTLTTSCNQAVVEPIIEVLGNYSPSGHDASRIVSEDGIAPTVKENHGTVTAVMTSEPINPMPDGTCRTIKNQYYKTSKANYERTGSMGATGVKEGLHIRKLTPKECFRLQDFDDEDFKKAEAVNSNTQLYKQAGNSITVACPYYIFKALIDANILIEKENKEMELKMNEYQLPEVIQFNYEELKQELTSKVSMYETMVYTDDQIKDAKADKANLNKLKKALNDERIRREREYMIPFNDFKSKINEIISIIDKPVAVIDKQVKEFEEQQKQEKLQSIKELWEGIESKPEGLALEEIFDSKWLNASTSMKSIQDAIDEAINKFNTDLATIKLLPEFSFEAEQIYISTLDINKAINEAHRMSEMAKKKAEFEATQAAKLAEQVANAEFSKAMNPPVEEVAVSKMETVEPAKQWISFSANLTIDQARELKKFFDDRAIDFKAI